MPHARGPPKVFLQPSRWRQHLMGCCGTRAHCALRQSSQTTPIKRLCQNAANGYKNTLGEPRATGIAMPRSGLLVDSAEYCWAL